MSGNLYQSNEAGGVRLSIIIPTCNRMQLLAGCLEALQPQVATARGIEVIICDDGADHTTREMVSREFPKIFWLQGPRRGPAANRNIGACAARGEWLIFLDDDCLPSKSYLSAYIDAIGAFPQSGTAFEGATISPPLPSLLWEAPHNPNGGILISCNFAIQKSHFFALGKFDERYPLYFEDTEFYSRLLASGGKTIFIKQALVEHPLRPVPGPSKLASRWEGKAIISLDYGAPPLYVMFRLPWHALWVIQSRFRARPLSMDNIRAAFLFACEWLLVCRKTPGWVKKHARRPRSGFWKRHFATSDVIPKYGF